MHALCLTVIAIVLAGCSGSDIQRWVPADADARARAYLALFTQHRAAEAERRLLPALAGDEAHVQLARIDSLLAGRTLDSTHVIGANVFSSFGGPRHTNLSYEIRSRGEYILANVATVDTAGTWFVEGISARPLSESLEEATAFSLSGRTPTHYVWLLLTVVCAACSLGTAVWLATQRAMPKRWRWVLLAAVGIGAFSMNWATGETAVRLLYFQLFSAGAVRRGPAAPWIITFALPIGALLSLRHYRSWRRGLAVVGPSGETGTTDSENSLQNAT